MCRPTATYLRVSALRNVRLPPLANVPAFAATSGEKTAMRPFAKLLRTLVISVTQQVHDRAAVSDLREYEDQSSSSMSVNETTGSRSSAELSTVKRLSSD